MTAPTPEEAFAALLARRGEDLIVLVDDSIVPRYVNLPPEGHIRNGMVVISGGRA